MKAKRGDLVRIDWLDILSENQWQDEASVLKMSLSPCVSYGIFIARKKDEHGVMCVYITATTSENDYNDASVIPYALITNYEVLNGRKKSR